MAAAASAPTRLLATDTGVVLDHARTCGAADGSGTLQDPWRTGQAPFESCEKPDRQVLRFTTNSAMQSTPATAMSTAGRVVIFGASDGKVRGLKVNYKEEQDLLWERDFTYEITAPPVVLPATNMTHGLPDYVVVAGHDSKMHALSLVSGDSLWSTGPKAVFKRAEPLVCRRGDTTIVIAPGLDGNAYAVDAASGDHLWKVSMGPSNEYTNAFIGLTASDDQCNNIYAGVNHVDTNPDWALSSVTQFTLTDLKTAPSQGWRQAGSMGQIQSKMAMTPNDAVVMGGDKKLHPTSEGGATLFFSTRSSFDVMKSRLYAVDANTGYVLFTKEVDGEAASPKILYSKWMNTYYGCDAPAHMDQVQEEEKEESSDRRLRGRALNSTAPTCDVRFVFSPLVLVPTELPGSDGKGDSATLYAYVAGRMSPHFGATKWTYETTSVYRKADWDSSCTPLGTGEVLFTTREGVIYKLSLSGQQSFRYTVPRGTASTNPTTSDVVVLPGGYLVVTTHDQSLRIFAGKAVAVDSADPNVECNDVSPWRSEYKPEKDAGSDDSSLMDDADATTDDGSGDGDNTDGNADNNTGSGDSAASTAVTGAAAVLCLVAMAVSM